MQKTRPVKKRKTCLSLLVIALAIPMLLPLGEQVLCVSKNWHHVSVETVHKLKLAHKADHASALDGLATGGDSCGHGHCTDIPLSTNLTTLAKANSSVKLINAFRKACSTAASALIPFKTVDYLSLGAPRFARLDSLPETTAHFLFILVRTIVLLN